MANKHMTPQQLVSFKLTKDHKHHIAPKQIAVSPAKARELEEQNKGHIIDNGVAEIEHNLLTTHINEEE